MKRYNRNLVQVTSNAGDGAFAMALKPMAITNRCPKQRVPVAPQYGDIVTVKIQQNTLIQKE